ncbi:MAG: hypothetical protein ACLQVF_21830, partial [Isosphaeraceae bacterium]
MSTESPPPDPDEAGESHDPLGYYYAVTSLVYDERGNVADVVRQDGRAPATTGAAARRFRWEHLLPRATATLSTNSLPFSKAYTRKSVESWTRHWDEHGYG